MQFNIYFKVLEQFHIFFIVQLVEVDMDLESN